MDTMIGIPARNEATTVADVTMAADAGLRQFCADGRNLIVLADNGSTDSTPAAFLAADTVTPQQVIHTSAAGTGKGSNVFALIEAALDNDVDRLILLDADVRSTEPAWIDHFATATATGKPTLVVPIYERDRYEAEMTNHVARPLVAALFGSAIQQPIGGDFALNRALLHQVAQWPCPDSASLYGIDIWLTTNTIYGGHQVTEVALGRKVHRHGFPKVLRLPQEVLDALFHVALQLDRPVPADLTVSPAKRPVVTRRSVPQDPILVRRVGTTVAGYLAKHRSEVSRLFPTTRDLADAPWGLRIGGQEWAHVLADAVELLADGRFQVSRDHLIALYINRALSFWEEVTYLTSTEVTARLDEQTNDTVLAVSKRDLRFEVGDGPQTFDRGYWTGIDLAPV